MLVYFVLLTVVIFAATNYFTKHYIIVRRKKPTEAEKKAYIINYIKQYNYTNVEVKDQFIDEIYDLYHNNNNIKYKLDEINEIDLIELYAVYYQHNLQYNNMIDHFLKSASLGNDQSYNNLAIHYTKVKDYDNAFKYCLLTIEHDNFSRLQKFIDLVIEQNKPQHLIKLYHIKPTLFNSEEHTKIIYEGTKKLIVKVGITEEISTIIDYIDIKYFVPSGKRLYPYKKLLIENQKLRFAPSKEYQEAKTSFLNKT